MKQEWKMKVIGLSSDWRTNVWRIWPPCGHKAFTPQTTMFSRQEVTCPKCGIRATAYYNDDKIVDLQQKTSD